MDTTSSTTTNAYFPAKMFEGGFHHHQEYTLTKAFMELAYTSIATFILSCIWSSLVHDAWVNPHFRITFATMDVLAAIYFLSRVRFVPGIWTQLRSPSPPTLAFLKSLPQHIPQNV
ncbi:hypothetical protein AA0113_g6824 [Alternaria arborescens]|uniref:Uncharacterized protein n=1 Tax=Alternaria arborescens TaxID=156630 RepID=A0A4Q4RVT5_9PLEO|nr:hypothetical protein AA0113_g6824 [Alternaria arborescens]